ncbi:MAG TPA: YtxH domain-containing protein [Gemmatimonadales bacterium]
MADEDREQIEAIVDEAEDSGGGTGAFAAGVVFGAFLGAAIALMFAPEKGDRTRRRLRKRLQRLREDASEGLERAGERTRRDLSRRRRRMEAGLGRAADRARNAL